ncbi:MAG: Fused DNA topoisomerase I/SWI domain-containing protein [Nitrosopumilales archaeon]|nr:MAG: Fused DNA topoisomerase I/SWI domain-containing protein [Nitrosopumilales archaeon]
MSDKLVAKRKSKSRRKTRKSKSRKSKSQKTKGKKKPFGGYALSFSGRTETVEEIFGRGEVTPSEMTKKLWKFIKAKKLANR